MPRHVRQPTFKSAYKPLLLLLVLFYLGFHAVSGERGVYAWFKETKRLETLKLELANVQAQRATLEHNVKLLSSSSLDLDMLDQQVRKVMGYSSPDEMVILNPLKMQ